MACRALVPAEEALREWDTFARPLYDHADTLVAENCRLIDLRRQLLAKAITLRAATAPVLGEELAAA